MDNKRFYSWLNEQLEEQTEFREIPTANPEQKLVILPNPDKNRTVTLKSVSVECGDCGKTVDSKPIKRHRKHQNGHWSHYCVVCKMYLDRSTGRWDIPNPNYAAKLNAAINDKKSNDTDQDQDQGTT